LRPLRTIKEPHDHPDLRGNPWDTIKEFVTGYNRRAQEREERVTAESMSRELGDGKGGLWLHREGDRLRMIVRPPVDPSAGLRPQLDQAAQIPQLEKGK